MSLIFLVYLLLGVLAKKQYAQFLQRHTLTSFVIDNENKSWDKNNFQIKKNWIFFCKNNEIKTIFRYSVNQSCLDLLINPQNLLTLFNYDKIIHECKKGK